MPVPERGMGVAQLVVNELVSTCFTFRGPCEGIAEVSPEGDMGVIQKPNGRRSVSVWRI